MICSICGENKAPYAFTQFTHMDESDKFFFVHMRRYPNGNPRNDVCWKCNAPYRCLGCGNVKSPDEFRLQGRYCHACKSTWRTPRNRNIYSIKTRATRVLKPDVAIGSETALESRVLAL